MRHSIICFFVILSTTSTTALYNVLFSNCLGGGRCGGRWVVDVVDAMLVNALSALIGAPYSPCCLISVAAGGGHKGSSGLCNYAKWISII